MKVASWLLRSAVTPPPSPTIFPNLPPRPLRSAQPLTLSSSRVSSILALFHVQVSLRFRQFSSNLRKHLLRLSLLFPRIRENYLSVLYK